MSARNRSSSTGTRTSAANRWSPSTPPKARCGPTTRWPCSNWAAQDEQAVTDNQRLTYQALASFLTSAEAQKQLLDAGYRPADLSLRLDTAGSPFADSTYVDWRQPQTTLQMPSPAVVDVVQNVWVYTKRPTNVFLVADTSGSMEGSKIDRAREALAAFVSAIRGERDQVGLVEFGSGIKDYVPLETMSDPIAIAC